MFYIFSISYFPILFLKNVSWIYGEGFKTNTQKKEKGNILPKGKGRESSFPSLILTFGKQGQVGEHGSTPYPK